MNSINDTFAEDENSQLLYIANVNTKLLQAFSIILPLIGMPGNTIAVYILHRMAGKDSVSAVFIKSLCVFNMIGLIVGLPRSIAKGVYENNFIYSYAKYCTFSQWVVCSLMSVTTWHIVLINGCRLITFFPRRLLSCDLSRDNVYHILQITIFFIVPGSLIILMNIGILIKVGSYRRFDHLKTPVVVKKERSILFACDIQILLNELPYAMQHLFGPKMFEDTPAGRYKFNFFNSDDFRSKLSLLNLFDSAHTEARRVNSDDFRSKLSLLNLFDSAHAEAVRERSQANVVEKLTTLKIQDSAV
uniref:G-protein coupled receptors family 1 profile domain-containing protein n=1 Tax=Biomphalaria glabrata TaxID=6526 RepID=A0A2C9LKL3_BIOGL